MLVVTGLSHKNTPEEIRSKAAFIKREALEAMIELNKNKDVDEVMVLSTCNRSEIYVVTEKEEEVKKLLRNFYFQKNPILKDYLYSYSGEEALTHLVKMACGLDSMILGEDQILAQLKEASVLARENQFIGKVLNQFLREAITFSKKIKTEYKISEVPHSIASTAVKYIIKRFPNNYKDKRILIVGSGETGLLILKHLSSEGFKSVTLTNRTYHPGDEFKEIFNALKVIKYEDRYNSLDDFDIVFSATSSPHIIFKKEELLPREKELLFIDLAIPKDIDKNINQFSHYELIGIDSFKEMINSKEKEREQAVKKINDQIPIIVNELKNWYEHIKLDPLVKRLNLTANYFANQTIEILNNRYNFTGKDFKFLKKIINSQFKNIVKPTLLKLKQISKENEVETINQAITLLDSIPVRRKN